MEHSNVSQLAFSLVNDCSIKSCTVFQLVLQSLTFDDLDWSLRIISNHVEHSLQRSHSSPTTWNRI